MRERHVSPSVIGSVDQGGQAGQVGPEPVEPVRPVAWMTSGKRPAAGSNANASALAKQPGFATRV